MPLALCLLASLALTAWLGFGALSPRPMAAENTGVQTPLARDVSAMLEPLFAPGTARFAARRTADGTLDVLILQDEASPEIDVEKVVALLVVAVGFDAAAGDTVRVERAVFASTQSTELETYGPFGLSLVVSLLLGASLVSTRGNQPYAPMPVQAEDYVLASQRAGRESGMPVPGNDDDVPMSEAEADAAVIVLRRWMTTEPHR